MSTPWLAEAVVISQDPDNYGLIVSLGSGYGGAGPSLPVRVLSHGPRDAVTGHFPALPTTGTPGIIGFPRSDTRNGVWLGAVSTQLTDADAHMPGNGGADYAAHFGGGYHFRSANGDWTEVFPDGTTLQVGAAPPALTRHTIDGTSQARQRTPFTAAQRRPQTPSAFPVSLSHPTGAAAVLSAPGAWHVTAAAGQTVTLEANGSTVVIDASGNVAITAPLVTISGNLRVFGTVTGGFGGADQIGLQSHRHGTGTNAAGTVAPTAGT